MDLLEAIKNTPPKKRNVAHWIIIYSLTFGLCGLSVFLLILSFIYFMICLEARQALLIRPIALALTGFFGFIAGSAFCKFFDSEDFL